MQFSRMLFRPPTQGASILVKTGTLKIWSILTSRVLIKILSLFNAQTNMFTASLAIFKHVGKALYSMGFNFLENGPIKNMVHFGLQGRGGRI